MKAVDVLQHCHQQYLQKVPWGYCPDHGTGVTCALPTGAKVTSAPEATEA
jgi:hypothetical protein